MRVFLTSTYVDLVEYQTKAFQASERPGQHGIHMEVFGARPGEASGFCTDEIDAADIIYAQWHQRLGAGPRQRRTQHEHRHARIVAPLQAFDIDRE